MLKINIKNSFKVGFMESVARQAQVQLTIALKHARLGHHERVMFESVLRELEIGIENAETSSNAYAETQVAS